MAKSKLNRDSKGDIKITNQRFRNEDDRYWRYTYVFKHYDNKSKRFIQYFDLEWPNSEKLATARKQKNFVEVKLYEMPDQPPYDKYITINNWQLDLLIRHFREVFNNHAFEVGYIPTHQYFQIIIYKKDHISILEMIKEYKLEKVNDLIFEIIAIAQKIYTSDVFHYESKEYDKRIKNAPSESKTLIGILDRMFDKSWIMSNKKPPPDLQKINFVYNDGVQTISDPWLTHDILQKFKKHLEEDSQFKNWKIELARYPNRYNFIADQLNFKINFTLSLYNLLKDEKLIKGETKTPNKLLNCIIKILNFSLIPIGSEGQTEAEKVKIIRNWVARKKLDKRITHLEVPADKKKLNKYFNKNFIDFTNDIKRADALIIANIIGVRFELMDLRRDFAHIAQCLKEGNLFISSQLHLERGAGKNAPKDYDSLNKLYKSIKNKQNFKQIKFVIDGDKKEYSLTEALPLFIVEKAIKKYIDNNQEEFETDILNAKMINKSQEGNYEIQYSGKLNLPEQRFMVTFVNSFYNYLLNEAPPKANEYSPSEKYYSIIAVMLQRTGFFHNQWDSEEVIVEKVKEWHQLMK